MSMPAFQAPLGKFWWSSWTSEASDESELPHQQGNSGGSASGHRFKELLDSLAVEHKVLQEDRDALAEENELLRTSLADKADDKFLAPPVDSRSEHRGPQQQVKFVQLPRLFAWEQAVLHALQNMKQRLISVAKFVANQRARRPDQPLQTGCAMSDLVEALNLVVATVFIAVCDHPERDGATNRCLTCNDPGIERKSKASTSSRISDTEIKRNDSSMDDNFGAMQPVSSMASIPETVEDDCISKKEEESPEEALHTISVSSLDDNDLGAVLQVSSMASIPETDEDDHENENGHKQKEEESPKEALHVRIQSDSSEKLTEQEEDKSKVLLRNVQQMATTLAAQNEALRSHVDRLNYFAGAALGITAGAGLEALVQNSDNMSMPGSMSLTTAESFRLSSSESLRLAALRAQPYLVVPKGLRAKASDPSALPGMMASRRSGRIPSSPMGPMSSASSGMYSSSGETGPAYSSQATESTIGPLPSLFGDMQNRLTSIGDSSFAGSAGPAEHRLAEKTDGAEVSKRRQLTRSLSRQISQLAIGVKETASLPFRGMASVKSDRKYSGRQDVSHRMTGNSVTSKPSVQGFLGNRKTRRLELSRTVTTILTQSPIEGKLTDTNSLLASLVILPSSIKRNIWDLIGSILIGCDIVLIPLSVFDFTGTVFDDVVHVAEIFTTCYWTVDVPRQFFQGYHVEGLVELRLSFIAHRYLRTWFLPDAFIVFVDWFFILMQGGGAFISYSRSGKVLRGLRVVRSIRLIRIAKMPNVLRLVMWDKIRGQELRTALFLLWVGLAICLLAHWVACYWYAMSEWADSSTTWIVVNGLDPDDFFSIYIAAFEFSMARLGMASTMVHATNAGERLYSTGVIFLSIILVALVTSMMTARIMQYLLLNATMIREQTNLRRFLVENCVSTDLSDCIWQWFHQKYKDRQRRVQDKDIKFLADLPLLLQMVLRKEVYTPMLQQHPLFDMYGSNHSRRISLICNFAVSQRHCMAEEEIFMFEKKAQMMYFVASGDFEYSLGGKRASLTLQESFKKVGVHKIRNTIQSNLSNSLAANIMSDSEASRMDAYASPCVAVTLGTFLCEPSLWLSVLHTGTFTSMTSSTLVQLSPDKLHMVLKEFGNEAKPFVIYARLYAERVVKPPYEVEEVLTVTDELLKGQSQRSNRQVKHIPDIPDIDALAFQHLHEMTKEVLLPDRASRDASNAEPEAKNSGPLNLTTGAQQAGHRKTSGQSVAVSSRSSQDYLPKNSLASNVRFEEAVGARNAT